MQKKHTPGPWPCRESEDYPGHYWIGPEWHTGPDNSTEPYMSVSGPIGEANARLIAASPELLAALMDVTALLEECACHRKPSVDEEIALDSARAAIAKATGGAE